MFFNYTSWPIASALAWDANSWVPLLPALYNPPRLTLIGGGGGGGVWGVEGMHDKMCLQILFKLFLPGFVVLSSVVKGAWTCVCGSVVGGW